MMYRKRRDFRAEMESRGWEFVPISSKTWSWVKLDEKGKVVAEYGDDIWKKDSEDASP